MFFRFSTKFYPLWHVDEREKAERPIPFTLWFSCIQTNQGVNNDGSEASFGDVIVCNWFSFNDSRLHSKALQITSSYCISFSNYNYILVLNVTFVFKLCRSSGFTQISYHFSTFALEFLPRPQNFQLISAVNMRKKFFEKIFTYW